MYILNKGYVSYDIDVGLDKYFAPFFLSQSVEDISYPFSALAFNPSTEYSVICTSHTKKYCDDTNTTNAYKNRFKFLF